MSDDKSKASQGGHKHSRPQWSGRDIVDAQHAPDLDREAALHEFEGKMPRHEAEDRAYGDYKRRQHTEAAAHHLLGIKLAQAAGDQREARKHGLMYSFHVQHLGHDPIGPVPKEVEQHRHGSGGPPPKVYTFKPHLGDIFVLSDNLFDKKEPDMSSLKKTTPDLEWQRHDDNTGGYLQALDKGERVLYRTWALDRGMSKAPTHVLVKHDGQRQTTVGYFDTQEQALGKAEEFVVESMAKSLAKEAQQLSLTPMGVPQTAKAEESSDGGSSGSSSTTEASSMSKGSESSASSSSSSTSTASSMSKAGGADGATPDFFSMAERVLSRSERCGKCGTPTSACVCGNVDLSKAETCKACRKAKNLCKCPGMHKSEAEAAAAAEEAAEHQAQLDAGKKLLKALQDGGSPGVGFGTTKDGKTEGTRPEDLHKALHDLYVATKFVVESAAAKKL